VKPTDGQTIDVAIIEDQNDVREGLAFLISDTAGYSCAGAWSSIEEALSSSDRTAPRVILLDLGLPGMSGIEGAGLLRERWPEAQILILTVYNDDDRIFAAMCAGACGYLLKNTSPARLLEAIREVAEGGAAMSPSVARRVLHLFQQFRPPEKTERRLTPQELRLLRLLGDGHHYKTAAAELQVSVHTVNFYLKNIYEKLQVHSKSEAVAKALRAGLIR
jgi:DNA-binding NarL/FixJ family response regulator